MEAHQGYWYNHKWVVPGSFEDCSISAFVGWRDWPEIKFPDYYDNNKDT